MAIKKKYTLFYFRERSLPTPSLMDFIFKLEKISSSGIIRSFNLLLPSSLLSLLFLRWDEAGAFFPFYLQGKVLKKNLQAMSRCARVWDVFISRKRKKKGKGYLRKVKLNKITLIFFAVAFQKDIKADFEALQFDRQTRYFRVVWILGGRPMGRIWKLSRKKNVVEVFFIFHVSRNSLRFKR